VRWIKQLAKKFDSLLKDATLGAGGGGESGVGMASRVGVGPLRHDLLWAMASKTD